MPRRCLRPISGIFALAAAAHAQVAPLPEADPVALGCDAEALRRAVEPFERAIEARAVLGAVLLVARGDQIVLHEALGHRDAERRRPMTKGTLFRMASNTKAVTAAAVLALVDEGRLTLDDPVAKWMPTFAHGDAAKITVRHLLTHTGGFRIDALFLSPLMKPSAEHPDAPNLVLEAARFGEVGPEVEPGTTYSYGNPGYNTLAALVEIASGQGYEAFCRERFYEPLGMRDTNNHETRADNSRMSEVVKRAGDRWHIAWKPGGPPTVPFVRGSGGLISTTSDFVRFCRMWLHGGLAGERRLLSEKSVAAALSSQTEHIDDVDYGFGWRIRGDGVFRHSGSDGTFAQCDAQRDLVVLAFTQTQGGKALAEACDAFAERVAAACPPQ